MTSKWAVLVFALAVALHSPPASARPQLVRRSVNDYEEIFRSQNEVVPRHHVQKLEDKQDHLHYLLDSLLEENGVYAEPEEDPEIKKNAYRVASSIMKNKILELSDKAKHHKVVGLFKDLPEQEFARYDDFKDYWRNKAKYVKMLHRDH